MIMWYGILLTRTTHKAKHMLFLKKKKIKIKFCLLF